MNEKELRKAFEGLEAYQNATPEQQQKAIEVLLARNPEDIKDLLKLVEWDWVISAHGNVLHHFQSFDDPEQAGYDWGGPGTTTCGRHTDWLCIPGIFSRMSVKRCQRCCKLVGYPQGVGSPKNDETLRPLIEARLEQP